MSLDAPDDVLSPEPARSAPPEAAPSEPTGAAPEHETVVDVNALRTKRLRIAAVVLLFVGSLTVVKLTGLDAYLDRETIRVFMTEAGALGFLAFLGAFAFGQLSHVPAWVFIGAATISYPQPLGALASYVGAIVSVMVTFYVVRVIGGQPIGDVKRPFVARALQRLETQPIRTVAVLRLVFNAASALNYALAMSRVRARDYAIGSALGLLIPVTVMSIFLEQLMVWLD